MPGSWLWLMQVGPCPGEAIYFRGMDDDRRPGWLKVMNEKPSILFDCSGDPQGPVLGLALRLPPDPRAMGSAHVNGSASG